MRQIRIVFLLFSSLFILSAGCERPPEGMVRIPGGEFIMGTDEIDEEDRAADFGIVKTWFMDEQPAHPIRLNTFFIDKFEVTHAQYRAFVQQTGRRVPPDWTGGVYAAGMDQHPVIYVTWNDASAYCQWDGKRLPTEAEWERAAKGSDGNRYPWGNEFDETKANVNNQVGHSTVIGQYEEGKSPYGVYDMTGNVWEWTTDWYKPYPGNSQENDKFGEKFRVLRGNSWAGLGHYSSEEEREIKAHFSRAGYRFFMNQNGYVNDAGFRCAKDPE